MSAFYLLLLRRCYSCYCHMGLHGLIVLLLLYMHRHTLQK